MNYTKMISALAIIMAIVIAPSSGAFAQTDIASDEVNYKQIYKDERKQLIDSLKEQRNDIKTQIKEFRDSRPTDRNLPEVEPTLGFSGLTSGWAEIGGKAYPVTLSLDGKAGQVGERGWKISGTGIAQVGERTVTFDLNGFAKKNHIGIKGVSTDNEFVVIHLRGHFAPIADSDNSYALAFKGAVANTVSDIKVPLVLVGDVQTFSLDSTVDESTQLVESEISESEIEELLDDLL
ncbi:MAG: hypothetical protein K5777_03675 [Nitrosopumilus sp.]|nr:hypothetical protein [Nitrosopumilus sp.]